MLASTAPWIVAAVFAIAAAAAMWALWRGEPSAGAGPVRFTIAPPEGATMTGANPAGPQAVVSPDGRYIVLGCPYDFDFMVLEREVAA